MTSYTIVEAAEDAEIAGSAIKLHGPDGFAGMHTAGRLAAEVLDMLAPHVVPGVTTDELNRLAHDMIVAAGAAPAPLNYRGFPKSICTSINHVVCHGIPGPKTLKSGDIVNIDVTTVVDGWHGDTSRMFLVGDVPLKARKLVDVTYEAMMLGIEQARPGTPWATSAMPSRAMRKSTATAWCAISAGTGLAACSTMRPTSSMSGGRAPASC